MHLLTGFVQANLYTYNYGYMALLEGDLVYGNPKGLARTIYFMGETENDVKYELSWHKQPGD